MYICICIYIYLIYTYIHIYIISIHIKHPGLCSFLASCLISAKIQTIADKLSIPCFEIAGLLMKEDP